jgi:hypothetical protein
MPTKRASRAARRRAEAKALAGKAYPWPEMEYAQPPSHRVWPVPHDRDLASRMLAGLAPLPDMGRPIRPECIIVDDPRAEAVVRHTLSDARVNAEAYRAIAMGEVTAELEAAVRDFVTRPRTQD